MTLAAIKLSLLSGLIGISFSLSFGQNAAPLTRPLAWVTVKEANGGFIDSLTDEDIEAYLGKVRLSSVQFRQEIVPTTVGLVIDLSSPVKSDWVDRSGRVNLAAIGFQRFLKVSGPNTEYFVSTFDKEYKTLLRPTSDTSQVSETLNALQKIEKGGRKAAVRNALQASFSDISKSGSRKKVLIFISEGADIEADEIRKASVDLSNIEEIAKRSDTMLYFIYVVTNDDFDYAPSANAKDMKPASLVKELMLRQPMELRTHSIMRFQGPSQGRMPYPLIMAGQYEHLAGITGGRMFYPHGQSEVSLALEIIANELKHQYLLSGETGAQDLSEKFQPLKVKIRKSSRTIVRKREGFYLK